MPAGVHPSPDLVSYNCRRSSLQVLDIKICIHKHLFLVILGSLKRLMSIKQSCPSPNTSHHKIIFLKFNAVFYIFFKNCILWPRCSIRIHLTALLQSIAIFYSGFSKYLDVHLFSLNPLLRNHYRFTIKLQQYTVLSCLIVCGAKLGQSGFPTLKVKISKRVSKTPGNPPKYAPTCLSCNNNKYNTLTHLQYYYTVTLCMGIDATIYQTIQHNEPSTTSGGMTPDKSIEVKCAS